MQKFFAKCNFDCGFISRKNGEEISLEKFSKMKSVLKPELLTQFVSIVGEAAKLVAIEPIAPVIQAVKIPKKVYTK